MHYYSLRANQLRVALLRRTPSWKWWTPSWKSASNAPWQQRQQTASWAALGKAQLADQ